MQVPIFFLLSILSLDSSPYCMTSLLFNLEMKGVVRALAGGVYKLA